MPAIAMPSISTKGSPSMIMRSAKVPLSPSSALQTMYLRSAGRIEHRLPLDAGREAGAAAAAQAGLGDLLDDVGRRHRDRVLQALQAAMRLVVVERQRVGDAAAREGQPRLPGEERDLVRVAERQRLCVPPVRKPASNRRWHVRRPSPARRRRGRWRSPPRPSAPGNRRRASRCARSWPRCRARRNSAAIALATFSAPSASAPESRGNVDAWRS